MSIKWLCEAKNIYWKVKNGWEKERLKKKKLWKWLTEWTDSGWQWWWWWVEKINAPLTQMATSNSSSSSSSVHLLMSDGTDFVKVWNWLTWLNAINTERWMDGWIHVQKQGANWEREEINRQQTNTSAAATTRLQCENAGSGRRNEQEKDDEEQKEEKIQQNEQSRW